MSWKSLLQKSQEVMGPDGVMRHTSTRSDYVMALIEAGEIESEEQLASRPDLLVAVHRHWITTGTQVGCAYAKMLNQKPADYGMMAEVVTELDEDRAVNMIREKTAEAATSKDVEALSLLLPNISNVTALCSLVNSLGHQPGWNLREPTEHAPRTMSEIYINVKLDFIQSGSIPSAVLALGPFNELPLTRRGPVVSLELRVKPDHAQPTKHRPHGVTASHLAQVPLLDGSIAEKHQAIWQRTKKMRLAVLGTDDERAKAEVTLGVPLRNWKEAIAAVE